MAGVRVIPRLDIKGSNLVKGMHLEGLRVLGKPEDFARRYSAEGADELIYVDIVASLYQRNSLLDIVERTAAEIFVPLTVGGGIRSTDDIANLLRAGADKVAINTAATQRPAFLTEAARMFGSQCVVLSIEAKRRAPGIWEAYTDNGRERTGRDALAWACEGVALGAGEVLVTSVDQEGTGRGYDLELTKAIASAVSVPVIACGGAGSPADVVAAVQAGHADAVALARLLHYGDSDIRSVKGALAGAGVEVRQ
jgi:cyclase